MEKQKVLVTGGTKGVGLATVKLLISQGYEVHLTYQKSAETAAQLMEEFPQQVFAHQLDQGSFEAVEQADFLIQHEWYGILFNAALGSGTVKEYAPQGGALDAPNDLAMMAVNAMGPLWIYKKVQPMLQQKTTKTKLIFISSVCGGTAAFPKFTLSDGMSKAAVAYLAKQLAVENTHTPIDVFCISPGSMETPMFYSSTLKHLSPSDRAAFEQAQAKGKLIQPTQLAFWLGELLRDESTLLHGANLDASMGLGARPGIQTEWK